MISQLMENMLDEYVNVPIRVVKNLSLGKIISRFDDCKDGYGYFLLEDGKNAVERMSPKREVWFSLISEVGYPLSVVVEYREIVDGEMVFTKETIQPEEFNLQLGDLRVTIQSDYSPCRISLSEYNIKARSLRVNFFEGEAVWVYLKLLPTGGGKEKESI